MSDIDQLSARALASEYEIRGGRGEAGYCERNPLPVGSGSYAKTEYSVSPGAQTDTYDRDYGSELFECRIGGETLRVTNTAFVGFDSGGWVPVQAEAHARHLQLGRSKPDWFVFDDAQKILTGSSAWSQLNLEGVHSDADIWDWSQPQQPGFRVNTDADHT